MRITIHMHILSRREHAHSKQSLHTHVHKHMYVRTCVSFTVIACTRRTCVCVIIWAHGSPKHAYLLLFVIRMRLQGRGTGAKALFLESRACTHQHLFTRHLWGASASKLSTHTLITLYVHTYIHTRCYAHTNTRTYAHEAHVRACFYSRCYAHTNMRTYAWCTCIFFKSESHIHAHIPAYMRTYKHKQQIHTHA